MDGIKSHFRNKFLAGILAAVPVVVVVVGVLWVEKQTRPIADLIQLPFPGLGILIAILAVYLLGVIVTSLLGRWLLRLIDRIMERIPGLKLLYRAWKDILVIGPGKKDMLSQVMLVPSVDGRGFQIAFTNGEALREDPARVCVFLPNVPNPVTGRLLIVDRIQCQPLNLTMEEAFKFLLSTGNYMPAAICPIPEKPV